MIIAIIVLSICLAATLWLALAAYSRAVRTELLMLRMAKSLRDAAEQIPTYIVNARAEDVEQLRRAICSIGIPTKDKLH